MKRFFLIYALFFTQFCAWSQTVIVADSVSRPARINRQNLFIKPNGSLFAMPRIGAPYALGLSPAERLKLDGIEAGANNYTHPSTHPASVIVQDAGNRFASDSEKSSWNGLPKGLIATTYANALTLCAALPTGVAALVKITADESSGNAGTGEAGANPTTYYLYFPTTGLIQQVIYPQ